MTQPNLRITIVGLNYSPEPSGNAPYTTSLAEGLAEAGHTVSVITGYPHYPEWTIKDGYSGWSRRETVNGVSVTRLRHYVPRKPTSLTRLHMELSFGLRAVAATWHRPEVVLVVSPALFSCAMVIARIRLLRRRPRVGIWVQDLYSRGVVETGTGTGTLGKLASSFESLVLRSADGVAAIHERFKSHMVHTLGVPEERVEVIRNWTHLPASPKSGLEDMRRQLGWAKDDIIVLHAGNMGKKQGLENVVEAARLAESRGSQVRFVLLGDGNQRKYLENLAEGATHLTFIDSLPESEFQRALASADFLLVNELPGVKDMAVPSKLTSYFNAGVPVIAATDQLSVTAFEIENSGSGVRVDAASPLALILAAEALNREPETRARLGENGLRFRQETLAEEAAIAHYDGFITTLAKSRDQ